MNTVQLHGHAVKMDAMWCLLANLAGYEVSGILGDCVSAIDFPGVAIFLTRYFDGEAPS